MPSSVFATFSLQKVARGGAKWNTESTTPEQKSGLLDIVYGKWTCGNGKNTYPIDHPTDLPVMVDRPRLSPHRKETMRWFCTVSTPSMSHVRLQLFLVRAPALYQKRLFSRSRQDLLASSDSPKWRTTTRPRSSRAWSSINTSKQSRVRPDWAFPPAAWTQNAARSSKNRCSGSWTPGARCLYSST